MKKIFVVIALATLSAATFAQTAEWLVSPQYSEIKYFGPKISPVPLGSAAPSAFEPDGSAESAAVPVRMPHSV